MHDTDEARFLLENDDVCLVPAAPVVAAYLGVAMQGGSGGDFLEPPAEPSKIMVGLGRAPDSACVSPYVCKFGKRLWREANLLTRHCRADPARPAIRPCRIVRLRRS